MDPQQKEQVIQILSDPNTIKQVTEKVFTQIDRDGSGFIDKTEFGNVCKFISKELGIPEPSQTEIDDSLKAIDQNQDGKISKRELGELIAFLFNIMIENIKNA